MGLRAGLVQSGLDNEKAQRNNHPCWGEMKDYLVRRISPTESYNDLLDFPRFFEIETVNACNARCPMCTINDWDRRDGLMSDDLYKRIVDEIKGHPEVKRVHLY